jgi:hypothetical protein
MSLMDLWSAPALRRPRVGRHVLCTDTAMLASQHAPGRGPTPARNGCGAPFASFGGPQQPLPALMIAGNITFCYKCGLLGAHRPLDCRMDFPAKARKAQEEKLAKVPLLVEPEAAPTQALTQGPTVTEPAPSQTVIPVLVAAPSTAEHVSSRGEDEPATVHHEMSVSSESPVPRTSEAPERAPASLAVRFHDSKAG